MRYGLLGQERFPRFDEVFTSFGAVLDLRRLHGKSIGVAHEQQPASC